MNKTKQKGTLSFDLEDYDAKKAFKRAVNADYAYLALCDISELIGRVNNNGYKYGPYHGLDELIEQTPKHKDEEGDEDFIGNTILRKLQQCFYDILESKNIDILDIE